MRIKRVAVGIMIAFMLLMISTPVSKAAEIINVTPSASLTTLDKVVAKKYTANDLKYLSCIIWCEAGNQSYSGKIAVGVVIMNRKRSHSFPNSVKGVIYQRGQFSPTSNGAMKKALKAYTAGKFKHGDRLKCVKAATAALNGQTYVSSKGKKVKFNRMFYFSRSLSHAKIRIGAHRFK